jgi:drug/metabolite transporter (DMT)-like permease
VSRWASARTVAVVALSLCTIVWGSTFFLAKGVVGRHDPMSVLTLRFATGSAVLFALRPGAVRGLPRQMWLNAAAVGAAYGLAQLPHYYGLRATSASAAGFLVGTYVVLTPLLDRVFFKVRSSLLTYAGVGLAVCGLAVFAFDGSSFGTGQLLCLVAALLYAVQIASMGAFSPAGQLWGFTTVLMGTITLIVGVPALAIGLDIPTSASDWLVIVYLALVAGAVAVGVQAWAQRRIAASHAAVIMAGEPLWAATLAVLFTAETVTVRLVLGGAVLLSANVVVSVDRARAHRPPPRD